MDLTHRPFLRSGAADRGLSVLVALIALQLAVFSPLVEAGVLNRHVTDGVAAGILGLGAFVLWTHLAPARLLAAIAVALVAIRVANLWLPDISLRAWDALFMLAGHALATWLVLRQVFVAPGRMNWHRVMGSVAAYLLVGLAFTQAFRLVAMAAPGAFLHLGVATTYERIVPSLNYFSFVTLVTLGYGDITPAHPVARGLAVLEAIVGVMYPAIMISWLLAQELEAEREAAREREGAKNR